jgi:hypothetical protein
MWCPWYRINTILVTPKFSNWKHWYSNIQNHYFPTIHHNCCKIIRILFIPSNSQEWWLITAFVNNSWMLKISKIEMSHRSIFSSRCKHTYILCKANIINCLIMSNQLGLNYFLLNIPDCTGCIYAWCTDHVWVLLVPIKACQWSTIFWMFVLNKQCLMSVDYQYIIKFGFNLNILCIFSYFPYPQIFPWCCNKVSMSSRLSFKITYFK